MLPIRKPLPQPSQRPTQSILEKLESRLPPFKGFGVRLRLALLALNGKCKKKVYDAATLAPLPPGRL